MRHMMLALLIGASMIAPACSAQGSAGAPEQRAPGDGRLMPPERVADYVWVMRQPDRLWAAVIGNVTIVEQTDGVVLIDSGGSIADGREVVRAVATLTPKPIKAVAITHWHNDHPLGLPGILEAFPNARVISTPATREFVRTETNTGLGKADPALDAARRDRAQTTIAEFEAASAKAGTPADMRAQYAIETAWIAQRIERQMGNYVVLPTETVPASLTLDDTRIPVELHFFGTANTHGDLMAWLPKQKIVVTGDAVVLPTPYGFTSSTKPWLETLAKLEKLPFATLIPGHGKIQHDRSYLAALTWSMNDIAARAKAAAATQVTKEQAVAAFDRTEHERRFGAKDSWTRLWLNDYWLQGMFETAFDEARGIPAPAK